MYDVSIYFFLKVSQSDTILNRETHPTFIKIKIIPTALKNKRNLQNAHSEAYNNEKILKIEKNNVKQEYITSMHWQDNLHSEWENFK